MAEARSGYPHVFLEYADSLDIKLCESTGIAPSVVAEARTELPHFQSAWDAAAGPLLGTTVREVGRPFERTEVTASLMVCPKLINMGTPILITYWPFLEITTNGAPLPVLYFNGIVFHELLHQYVNAAIGTALDATPLMRKYASEPPLVLKHLHVDSVQKLVYLALGRDADLDAIVQSDSSRFGADYQRAWTIVNDLEDYRAFAAELRPR